MTEDVVVIGEHGMGDRSMLRKAAEGNEDLSWDETLCNPCRQFFDDFIVHNQPREDDDIKHIDPPWPHSLASTEKNASLGCRLCNIAWSSFRPSLRDKRDYVYLSDAGEQAQDISVCLEWIGGLQFDILLSVHPSLLENTTIGRGGVMYRKLLDARIEPLPTTYDPCSLVRLSPNTGSAETLSRIRTWLEACRQTHPFCAEWTNLNGIAPVLPGRLIKIAEGPRLCLVKPSGNLADYRYTTLSHCWGGQLPIMLRSDLLESFENDIPWISVPKTFQDAIIVTQALGIAYIWIDALCIVQDAIDDWSAEAAKMASVYANAELNISSNHASDSSGGLFVDRDTGTVECFSLKSKIDSGDRKEWMCYADTSGLDISHAPIHSRAWVMQEYSLARRIVYFGRDQVHWECACHLSSEALPPAIQLDFPQGDFIGKGYLRDHDNDESHDFWEPFVENFTKCDLTFISDRPVAISGIARMVAHRLGMQSSDFLCGLWRPRLMHNLMWRSYQWCGPHFDQPDSKCRRSSDASIPSWSWLSVMGNVRFEDLSEYIMNVNQWDLLQVGEVLDAKTLPSTADNFGPVDGGSIQIRSILKRGTLRRNPANTKTGYNLTGIDGYDLTLSDMPPLNNHALDIYLDNGRDHDLCKSDEQVVYVMLGFVVTSRREGQPRTPVDSTSIVNLLKAAEADTRPSYRAQCATLLLIPAQAQGTFRRIGFFVFYWPSKCLDNGEQWSNTQPKADLIPRHLYHESFDDDFYSFTIV